MQENKTDEYLVIDLIHDIRNNTLFLRKNAGITK
jgi:hypothetical protein